MQPVTEISMVFRGEAFVRRRDSGETHTTHAGPSVIWLCTAGQQIDWLEMEQGALEILAKAKVLLAQNQPLAGIALA